MSGILTYQPQYAIYFRDLNLEWLEHFFYVEPHDAELLESCQEVIIDNGGHIFFYEIQGKVVGTFALIKLSPGVFELGKMAVSKDMRGKGIGQKMMSFCLDFAKENKLSRLILYSNTKLSNSIHIYKKYGFHEIPIGKENPYKRSNIKMELNLF